MRTAISGERKRLEPSRCERKVTPSGVSVRSSLRLKTWNPPLSVRIGPSQFMKRWSPPSSRTSRSPGRRCRW